MVCGYFVRMRGMVKSVLGVVLAASVVLGVGASAGAAGPEVVVEVDLAHHGHVSLWDGRVGVWLVSENHGPSDLSQATVRLAFSEPMAGGMSCRRPVCGAATGWCPVGRVSSGPRGPSVSWRSICGPPGFRTS